MKSTTSIMNMTWKKLFILPLILAALVTPLCAQTDDSIYDRTNAAASAPPAAPTQPAPQVAPAPPAALDPQNPNHYPIRPDDMVNVIAIVSVFGGGVAVFALFFYFRHRRHQILHETLRTMIEKGVPIPPELLSRPQENAPPRIRNDFRTGLILVCVGLALMMITTYHMPNFGLIPFLIGIAFLIAWKVEQKKKDLPDK
jgi:hypothetical protein